MFYVKLSDASITELREMIGVDGGRINLTKGIVLVNGVDNLKKVAEKFGIDNVNNRPYEEVVAECTAPKEPASKKKAVTPDDTDDRDEMKKALEERNKIIGYKLEIGSVVRVKHKKGCEHAVIVAVYGDKYAAAKLALSKVTPETYKGAENTMMILLEKGKDIVYRNTTYKDLVTLLGEVEYDLEWKDFLKSAGGMIVGKVTNLDLIQPIIDGAAYELDEEPEEEAEEEAAGSEEEPANQESTKNEQPHKGINFQRAIEESETLEELFSKLGVASDILMQAAEECIETGRSNVKKLIPILQSKYEKAYGRLTQSAIKNKMNEEMKEWCESHDVDMEECSVGYFLKAIVKGMKKS